MSLHNYLRQVVERRETLSRADARALLDEVFSGRTDTSTPDSSHALQLAALLGAISARGEAAAELAGFVDAMRAAATPLPLDEAERDTLVDTCGTGGDQSGTFNISTAAALVAAASAPDSAGPGIMVAKHGNRAVTSPPVRPTSSKLSASRSTFRPPTPLPRSALTASPTCTRPRCIRQ